MNFFKNILKSKHVIKDPLSLKTNQISSEYDATDDVEKKKPMPLNKTKYHKCLGEYFFRKPLYLDIPTQKKPNTRKLMEQPWQQTKAEMWDEAVETLCNLYFIKAKCEAGLTFALSADYRLAIYSFPEGQIKYRDDILQKEQVDKWTNVIIEYSRKWSELRRRRKKGEKLNEPEPQLPEPLPSCRVWTQEEINAECARIIKNPTQLDILNVFERFVISESYSLSEYSSIPGFVMQHAFNSASKGPVHEAAHSVMNVISVPLLLQHKNREYNPKQAVMDILEGQIQGISCVSVTADGRRAISSSWDRIKPIRIWDLGNGQCLFTLQGHEIEVEGVIISPDGRLAVSVCRDKTIRVWDLHNHICERILTGHTQDVDCISMTPDGQLAVSGGHDRTIRVWDLETGECLHLLEGHENSVCCVSITPDGRRALSGGHDNSVFVWDIEKGLCMNILKGHTSTVTGVCITMDGRFAVSGGWDLTVRVWDLEAGNCLRVLKGHTQAIRSVSITADGHLGVSGSGSGGYPQDYTVRAWDLHTGDCIRILNEHIDIVNTVSITPDGRHVLSGSYDSTIRVWDLESGQNIQTPKEHKEWINSLYISADERYVLSTSKDNTLRMWDLDKKICLSTIEKIVDPIITPDWRRTIGRGPEGTGTLRVWDLKTGTCLHEMNGGKYPAHCLSVTKKGNRVVAGINDGMLQIWDLESGQCIREIKGHSQCVSCLTLLPNGHATISGSNDASLKVWDIESGECLNNLIGHTLRVNSVALVPDGSRAVSGGHGMDSAVRVWDLKSGACLHTLVGHTSGVTSLCITPDGKRAISASRGGDWERGTGDNRILVWDIENGRCIHTLTGHSLSVNSLIMHDEGRFIVSGSWDKTVRVWDIEKGKSIALYRAPVAISAVSMTKSMDSIICGTRSGELIFLELRNIKFVI